MSKLNRKEISNAPNSTHIQFSLIGLAVFSLLLVVGTGALMIAIGHFWAKSPGAGSSPITIADTRASNGDPKEQTPPWGELIKYDVAIDPPGEYLDPQIIATKVTTWVFEGMQPAAVHELLVACGLSASQIEQALSPRCMTVERNGTIIKPTDDLVFALEPESRTRLYTELARFAANGYMQNPFRFPGTSFDDLAKTGFASDGIVSMIRSLLYRRGDVLCFSDYVAVINRIPAKEDRLAVAGALFSESCVLARLHIRPTSDIEKILNYWTAAPGVRVTDLRSLLESLKRLPEGGSISILYVLPPFARERLYTFPLPSDASGPTINCHWSTMNFFSKSPDDRFADANYTRSYVLSHFYRITKPTRYGDVIFLVDKKGDALHSAVYLADDLVFTKNGEDSGQPWTLMRLDKMVEVYSATDTLQMLVYRNKNG